MDTIELCRALGPSLTDVVVIADPEGLIAAPGAALGARLGLTFEHIAGRPLTDLVAADDADTIAAVRAAVREGTTLRRSATCRSADGPLTGALSVLPIGTPVEAILLGFAPAATDPRGWQAILDAVGEPLVVLDAGLVIREVNGAAAALVDAMPATLRGRRCWRALHHGDCAPANCPAVRTLRTGEPTLGRITRHGAPTLEVMCWPIRGIDGRTVGAVERMRLVTVAAEDHTSDFLHRLSNLLTVVLTRLHLAQHEPPGAADLKPVERGVQEAAQMLRAYKWQRQDFD